VDLFLKVNACYQALLGVSGGTTGEKVCVAQHTYLLQYVYAYLFEGIAK